MKKYDVLILSSLPGNSGCFLRAKYLANSLVNAGLKVKLIKPLYSLPFMLDFFLSFFLNTFFIFFYNFKFGFAIKPYPNTLIPLLIKRLFVKNKIGVDIDDIDYGYREGMINKISRLMQKPFPKNFDIVTFHNPLLKKFISQEFNVDEKNMYQLLQGVDFTVFNIHNRDKNLKVELIRNLNLKKNVKLIVYSAHLNIASDLDIILEYIGDILEKRDYFFIVAGGGPLLNYFKELAKQYRIKNIFFTGFLTPEKIADYIAIGDVLIAYYKDKEVNYYRSYMKIREYLALKKRVVCNKVGELKEFKEFTYQTDNDIKKFIKKIDFILKNNFSDKREIKGFKFVKNNYDWNIIGKKFANFLGRKFL